MVQGRISASPCYIYGTEAVRSPVFSFFLRILRGYDAEKLGIGYYAIEYWCGLGYSFRKYRSRLAHPQAALKVP